MHLRHCHQYKKNWSGCTVMALQLGCQSTFEMSLRDRYKTKYGPSGDTKETDSVASPRHRRTAFTRYVSEVDLLAELQTA